MTEFEMAYHHNVAVKRKKRLIVLMVLDSLNNHNNNDDAVSDTTMLRQFVSQYTYIDYTGGKTGSTDCSTRCHFAVCSSTTTTTR